MKLWAKLFGRVGTVAEARERSTVNMFLTHPVPQAHYHHFKISRRLRPSVQFGTNPYRCTGCGAVYAKVNGRWLVVGGVK